MNERIDYIITVRPVVYVEYTIEAESEEEAWKKFHNDDYISKEDNFTDEYWKPATIDICYVTIIPGHSTAEESRQIGWNVNKS